MCASKRHPSRMNGSPTAAGALADDSDNHLAPLKAYVHAHIHTQSEPSLAGFFEQPQIACQTLVGKRAMASARFLPQPHPLIIIDDQRDYVRFKTLEGIGCRGDKVPSERVPGIKAPSVSSSCMLHVFGNAVGGRAECRLLVPYRNGMVMQKVARSDRELQ